MSELRGKRGDERELFIMLVSINCGFCLGWKKFSVRLLEWDSMFFWFSGGERYVMVFHVRFGSLDLNVILPSLKKIFPSLKKNLNPPKNLLSP